MSKSVQIMFSAGFTVTLWAMAWVVGTSISGLVFR